MGFEQLTGELPGDSSSTTAEYAAHSCSWLVVSGGAGAVSQHGLEWGSSSVPARLGVEQGVVAAAAALSPSKAWSGCRL